MLYYLSPVSPLHTGYPNAPEYSPRHPTSDYYGNQATHYHYGHPVNHYTRHHFDLESDVERAAHEYALAQRRVRALQQQHIQRARLIEQQRREQQQRAEAEAMVRIAIQQAAVVRQRRLAQLYDEYVREQAEEALRLQAISSYRHEAKRQQELLRRQKAEAQKALLYTLLDKASQSRHVKATPTPLHRNASVQDLLRRRLETDEDTEVREVIEGLLGSIFNEVSATTQPTKQDKGKGRETPAIPFPWTKSTTEHQSLPKKTVHFDTTASASKSNSQPAGADLKRTPATRIPNTSATATQLALGAIDRISVLLQELKGSFVFPTELDHASAARSPSPILSLSGDRESAQLPFTSRNKPIHVYEHALNGLLAKLDEVESNGDEEVRRRRKEVVIEVEKALEDVEKHVAEMSPKSEKAALRSDVPDEGVMEATAVETTEQALLAENLAVPEGDEVEHTADGPNAHTEPRQSTDAAAPSAAGELPAGTDTEIARDTTHTLETFVDHTTSLTPNLQVEAVQPETAELVPEVSTSEPEFVPRHGEADTEATPADATPAIDEFSSPDPEIATTDKADISSVADSTECSIPSSASEQTDTDLISLDTPVPSTQNDLPAAKDPALLTPSSEVTNDAFLLQPESHDDDSSYERAKARIAASKEGTETEWEDAELASVSDGETWSEVE